MALVEGKGHQWRVQCTSGGYSTLIEGTVH